MSARTTLTRVLLGALLLLAPLLVALGTATPAQAGYGPMRWDCLAHYESTHRWHINNGNGHYGGLQFSLSTWKAYGGPRGTGNFWPHKATRREQIKIAKRVAFYGYGQHRPQGGRHAWPHTWYRCF